jgi:hypothetical protein
MCPGVWACQMDLEEPLKTHPMDIRRRQWNERRDPRVESMLPAKPPNARPEENLPIGWRPPGYEGLPGYGRRGRLRFACG